MISTSYNASRLNALLLFFLSSLLLFKITKEAEIHEHDFDLLFRLLYRNQYRVKILKLVSVERKFLTNALLPDSCNLFTMSAITL